MFSSLKPEQKVDILQTIRTLFSGRKYVQFCSSNKKSSHVCVEV